MTITNKDNLSQAVSKSSSLGLAGSVAILLSNLVFPITEYVGLPDIFFLVAAALAIISFALLAFCFNNQRKAAEDVKTKKNIGYVVLGCILAAAADSIFLLNDILYTVGAGNNTSITRLLLLLCDLMIIAAFVFLTYYFIFLKKQRVFSKSLDNIILVTSISYMIKTVLNFYSFVIRMLEASGAVQQGALKLPLIFTDIMFILISIPMVLFFVKVKK